MAGVYGGNGGGNFGGNGGTGYTGNAGGNAMDGYSGGGGGGAGGGPGGIGGPGGNPGGSGGDPGGHGGTGGANGNGQGSTTLSGKLTAGDGTAGQGGGNFTYGGGGGAGGYGAVVKGFTAQNAARIRAGAGGAGGDGSYGGGAGGDGGTGVLVVGSYLGNTRTGKIIGGTGGNGGEATGYNPNGISRAGAAGTGGAGVAQSADSIFVNAGTVTGGIGGNGAYAALTQGVRAFSYGGVGGAGVQMANASLVDNASGSTITGGVGGLGGGAYSSGSGGVGVAGSAGGMIYNRGGTITGGAGGAGNDGDSPHGVSGAGGGGAGVTLAGTTGFANTGTIAGGAGGHGGAAAGTEAAVIGGGGGTGVAAANQQNFANAGTISGGAGGDGGAGAATGTYTDGANGAGGGTGVTVAVSGQFTNRGTVSGGAGGSGGTASSGTGGSGGAGGAGIFLEFGTGSTGSGTVDNYGVVKGGQGGAGGSGSTAAGIGGSGGYGVGVYGEGSFSNHTGGHIYGGAGRDGGAGGDGIVMADYRGMTTASLTNAGSIAGGAGNGSGVGGVGVAGDGITVTNSGTIAGGLSGDGTTQADAIDFLGGDNVLVLEGAGSGASISGAIGILNGSTLRITPVGTQTLGASSVIYGGDGITIGDGGNGGSGTLIIDTIEPGGGFVTIDKGYTGQLGDGTTAGGIAGNVYLTDNGTVAFDNAADSELPVTPATHIGGTGRVVQKGSGVTLLYEDSGDSNTYRGGTVISNGTLVASNGTAFDSNGKAVSSSVGTGTITFDGGALELDPDGYDNYVHGDATQSTAGFTLANRIAVAGTGSMLLLDGQASTYMLTGAVGGTGTLTIGEGTGNGNNPGSGNTLVLSGTNTFTGTFQVSAVTLLGGAKNAFGPLSAVKLSDSATLDLGGFDQSIGSLADGRNDPGTGLVTDSGAAATFTVGGNDTSTSFSGLIEDGVGTIALVKTGTGTFTLAGTNTYSGGTTVADGILALSHATGGVIDAASTGAIEIEDAALVLKVSGTLANDIDLAPDSRDVIAARTGTTVTSSGRLDIEPAAGRGTSLIFGSSIQAGTVVLDGAASGGPLDLIGVYGGTLQAAAGNDELDTLTAGAERTQIGADGTLDFNGADGEIANLFGNGTLTNESGATTTIDLGTFGGVITGAGDVAIAGAVTLSGASTLTGMVTIDARAVLSLTQVASLDEAAGIVDDGRLNLSNTVLRTAVTGSGGVFHTGTLEGDGTGGELQFVTNKHGRLAFTGDGDSFSGTLGGNGTIELRDGSDSFEAGLKLRSATLELDGADLTLAAGQFYGNTFQAESGTLDLSGNNFSLTGTTYLKGSIVEGGGNLFNAGAMSVRNETLVESHLGNSGKLFQRATLLFDADGNFSNAKGATDTILGDFDILGSAHQAVNAGLIEKTAGKGVSRISGNIANNGTIEVDTGTLDLTRDVGGTGTLAIEGNSTMELGSIIAAGQTVAFGQGNGTLQLDGPQAFHGTISHFNKGDAISLAGFDDMAKVLFEASSSGSGGTLTVTEKGHHFAAQLTGGTYEEAGFHLTHTANGDTIRYAAPKA